MCYYYGYKVAAMYYYNITYYICHRYYPTGFIKNEKFVNVAHRSFPVTTVVLITELKNVFCSLRRFNILL